MSMPVPPLLVPMTQVTCAVADLVSLGAAPCGERRYVPLGGGTVRGPELNGSIVEGGVDWQLLRADSVLEIGAHYVVRTDDGALVEVRSDGLRHGPADVMARLASGENVPRDDLSHRNALHHRCAGLDASEQGDRHRLRRTRGARRPARRLPADLEPIRQ